MPAQGLTRWEVAGVIAGLGGYVYVLGGVVSWARFFAAGVPADQAVAMIDDRVLFAVGLRSLLVVAVLTSALFAAAYIVSRRGWEQHKDEWTALPTIKTAADDRFARIAAGLNAIVISGVFAVAVGGLASQLPGTDTVNDILVTAAVVGAFVALSLSFLRSGPWLLRSRRRRVILVILATGIALVSALPIAMLIAVGVLLTLLGRTAPTVRHDSVVARLRTRLPYLLAAAYTLVGFAYESLPPVSFPRAEVTTAGGTTIGGYVGRNDDGVYLLTCRGNLRGESADPAMILIPKEGVSRVRLSGEAFRVDSGARPSPLEQSAAAIDLSASDDLTLISPELPGDVPTCAADAPGDDTTGLGAKVLVDPRKPSRVRTTGSELLVHQDGTPQVIAQLMRRFQPTLEVTVEDRFWPVAVSSVLQEKGRKGGRTCLVVSGGTCRPEVRLAQLDRAGSAADYLDLPEQLASDPDAQFEAFMRGQGIDRDDAQKLLDDDPAELDPWRTAQLYAYFAGKVSRPDHYVGVPEGLLAIQYWFYYPYNYYPVTVNRRTVNSQPIAAIKPNGSVDQHEGDWEQVTVFLNDALAPQYLYMARHDGEGVAVPWDRVLLDKPQHPVVQAAFGGHPTYPNVCGGYPRPAALKGNLSDYVVCGSGRFAFRGRTTALANLARAPWACWPGHFGQATRRELENAKRSRDDPRRQVKVAGPRSPLWQAPNRPVCSRDPLAGELAFMAGIPTPAPPQPLQTTQAP